MSVYSRVVVIDAVKQMTMARLILSKTKIKTLRSTAETLLEGSNEVCRPWTNSFVYLDWKSSYHQLVSKTVIKLIYCCCSLTLYRKYCSANNTCKAKIVPWRVLFFGTTDFSVATLRLLNVNRLAQNHSSALVKSLEVVTGSEKEVEAPVRKFALQHSLQTYSWPPCVQYNDYDVGIVASFGHLIPEKLIKAFPWGILNVHASLLPRWRGAAPIVHTVLNGDKETGVSIMKIEPKHFDIGNVLLQRSCLISDRITAKQLTNVLAELGAQLIIECLKDLPTYLSNSMVQDVSLATKAPKITSQMSIVNWSLHSTCSLDRLCRAIGDSYKLQTSWNGTSVKLDDFLAPSVMDTLNIDLLYQQQRRFKISLPQPGDIYFHKKRNILCVRCQDGWVGLKSLQVSGYKTYTPREFYNGFLSKVDPRQRYFTDVLDKLACSI